MIRPLIITPLVAACGGACNYLVSHFLGYQGGWKRALAILIGVVGFVIALWMGIVLGLAGTLWH
jgi:hypothetical protein